MLIKKWQAWISGPFLPFLGLFLFTSCSDTRIFDRDHDFEGASWHIDSIQTFVVEVTDTASRYNFYYRIRNAADYEFYNLYLKYTLEDSLHRKIKSELQELILFDPKTGSTYGSGLGDIFSHEFPAVKNYSFPTSGKYYFKIQQYMREEELEGIHSAGLRIDKAEDE